MVQTGLEFHSRHRAQFAVELILVLTMVLTAMGILSAYLDSGRQTENVLSGSAQISELASVVSSSIERACLNSLQIEYAPPCPTGANDFKLSSPSTTSNSFLIEQTSGIQYKVSKPSTCQISFKNFQGSIPPTSQSLSCENKLCIYKDQLQSKVVVSTAKPDGTCEFP